MARLAAGLNVLSGLPTGLSVWVLSRTVVRGDSAATAANILGSENLFRLGWAAEMGALIIFPCSALLLYERFKPASRGLSRLMLVFCAVAPAIQALDTLPDMAALHLLRGGTTLASLSPPQAQDLAFLCLRLHPLIYDAAPA
jgi:hypothetical protein